MSKKSQKGVYDSLKDTLSSWVDPIYSSIVFVVAKTCGLDNAFTKVVMSSNWGILSPFENNIICDKYGACAIPFYECTFSTMCLCLPFTAFEVEVMRHFSMTLLQIHPTC